MITRLLMRLRIRRIVKQYEKEMIRLLEDAAETPAMANILENDCEVSKVMIRKKNNGEKETQ